LGRRIQLDDGTFTVVGILPESTEIPHLEAFDIWTPLPFDPRDEENRGWRGFRAFGRLKNGTSIPEAQKEMDVLAARMAAEYPETSEGWSISVRSLHEQIVGDVRPLLLILLGAVSFVLLIGCANVANLLLARASERRREFAVRAAIGAGRGHLVRQLLMESLLLSILGGAAGLLIASWATEVFLSLAPSGIPRLDEVSVDGRVLGFTAGLSIVTSVLFGLFPAFHAAAVDLNLSLKEGEQLAFGSSRLGVRGLLVASETALALVLLIGASLLIQSFLVLTRWEPGFERENLLTTWLLASSAKYETADQAEAVFQQAIDEVEALPSIESVGATSAGPLFGGKEPDEILIEGRPVPPAGERPVAQWYDVSPNYFRTLGLPMLRGRDFTLTDRRRSSPVAIVNETLARRFWDDRNPIGDRIRVRDRMMTIVGVVGDVQPFRPGDAIQPEVYWPKQQAPRYATYLVIRTEGDPSNVTHSVQDRLKQLDPDMGVSRMTTMEELIDRRLVSPRFHMLLMGSFGLVALVLAVIGTYGVITYSVSRQTRELGIRLALGARAADIVRSVVQRGMAPTLLGVVLGLAGAVFLTRFLSSYVFGVRSTDLPTYLGVALILSFVALLACIIPARRATRISTMDSLRYE
jgi:putative ABC transport system permease protein